MKNYLENTKVEKYTKEQINIIVNKNRTEILQFCKEAEDLLFNCNPYQLDAAITVYFNLKDEKCYTQVKDYPADSQLYYEILRGNVIEVYNFDTYGFEDEVEAIEDYNLNIIKMIV